MDELFDRVGAGDVKAVLAVIEEGPEQVNAISDEDLSLADSNLKCIT